MMQKLVVGFFICLLLLQPFSLAYAQNNQQYFPLAEVNTYLTFPEWYIVFSAQEYAAFLKHNPPSDFPYFAAVGQYWQSYGAVYNATKNKYPFSFGDHLMLVVIGVSYSAEYVLKGVYEPNIGRLTEYTTGGHQSLEDIYAQKVAADYGDFLVHTPWYDFPYFQKLTGLWYKTPFIGSYPIRSIERKYILSVEYALKGIYGALIKAATESSYAPANPEVTIKMQSVPAKILKKDNRITLIAHQDKQTDIIAIPRYDIFNEIIPKLAAEHLSFYEMAGNKQIMITAIAPKDYVYTWAFGNVLFSQEIVTDPTKKRIAIDVPIEHLTQLINTFVIQQVIVEHIYDY